MYGLERYLFKLKEYVRNRARQEACIASGNLYTKALGFIIEHFSFYPQSGQVWDLEDDQRHNGEVL
jgi:hypothetical protein